MKFSYQGLPTDMPIFMDGNVPLVWDPSSKTFVPKPGHDVRPDRSHATGGDNDLFDPFTHTEQPGVPELEGYMASADMETQDGMEEFGEPSSAIPRFQPGEHVTFRSSGGSGIVLEAEPFEGGWWYRVQTQTGVVQAPEEACLRSEGADQAGDTTLGDLGIPPGGEDYYRTASEWAPPGKVNCPNCKTTTEDHVCPTCGKDLTPEWNQESDRTADQEFQDVHVPYDTRNEFISDPERVPKRNQLKTDDSFPSMNLSHIAPLSSVKPLTFSSYAHELEWREANDKNLSDCPECGDVLHEQDGEMACHGCGHKQKIIHTAGAAALLAVPELLGAGAEAGAAGGAAAGAAGEAGAAGGGGLGLPGMGSLMNKAMMGGAFREGENAIGKGEQMGAGPDGGDFGGGGGEGYEAPGTYSHTVEAGLLGEIVEGIMHAFKNLPATALQGAQALPGVAQQAAQAVPGAIGKGADMLADPKNPLSYVDDVAGAVTPHNFQQNQALGSTFGNDDVGTATKNDGSNSDPDDASNSGTKGKEEQGDGPEQLKDADGPGAPTSPDQADQLGEQGDPHIQDKALKAFHMNMPLILEFSESPESGSSNPILLAIDQMLEEAFPGYRGGMGDGTSEHPQEGNNEAPSEDESGEAPDEGDSKEKPSSKESSNWAKAGLWHSAEFDAEDFTHQEHEDKPKAWEDDEDDEEDDEQKKTAQIAPNTVPAPGQQPQWGSQTYPGDAFAPGAPGVAGAPQPCAQCGQPHAPGTPCPQDATQNVPQPMSNGAPVSPGGAPNMVTTKWEIVASYENIDGFQKEAIPGRPGIAEMQPQLTPEQISALYEQEHMRRLQEAQAEGQSLVPAPGQDENQAYFQPNEEVRPRIGAVDDEFGFYTASDEPHHEQVHEHRQAADWVDADGAPLQKGHDYDLLAQDYAIPDKITVNEVYPDKISYTMHPATSDEASLPYHAELTKQEFQTMSYQFVPSEHADEYGDSGPGEHPVRPGQDPTPQVDDLTTPSTVVSSVDPTEYMPKFAGDSLADRDWIRESNSPGDAPLVDPALMAKLAGKDFSAREQREFIDENGTARNLDMLDLEGTHYTGGVDDAECALW